MERENKMLRHLSELPRRMLCIHGRDNMTEFVLHHLCHEDCFNLKKAAYFVDAPDFNVLKGVAGFNRGEQYDDCKKMWHSTEEFTEHMRNAEFNKRVRELSQASLKKDKKSDEELAQEIAHNLGFENPCLCIFDMKHDNHGIFIYEKNDKNEQVNENHLLSGLSLLSFCPIF